MRDFLLLMLFLGLAFINYAQGPNWLNADYRSLNYAADTYFSGYSSDNKLKKESVAEALERVKKYAKADVAESIIIKIESVSQSNSQSTTHGNSESFSNVYESTIKAETKAEIAGVKVESYFDNTNNMVYAFAYANKYELTGYYKSQIPLLSQQIKNNVAIAAEFIEKSEKPKAKLEYLKTVPLFAKIEYFQGILLAIGSSINNKEVLVQEIMDLKLKVNESLLGLEQGIYILINCDSQLFGQNYTLLESKLKSELFKNDCIFTNEKEQADWIITVKSKAREHSHPQRIYFSFVNVNVELIKTFNNTQIYQNEFEKKGASMDSYRAAAEKAYNDLPIDISTELLKFIMK